MNKKIKELAIHEKDTGSSEVQVTLLTEKIEVKGDKQHPLYSWLTNKELNGKSNSTIKWNFQKYIVNEKGELLNYFLSTTKPMSPKITSLVKQ